MPDTKPTEAQLVYERIEELKAGGMTNADAIRTVAEVRGKTENAVRANQHHHRQKLTGGSGAAPKRRSRTSAAKPELTVEGAVAEATRLLEGALAAIDGEVDAAKAEFDAAKARYDALVASVKDRKATLEKKIKALG